jgi:hypothetical protein
MVTSQRKRSVIDRCFALFLLLVGLGGRGWFADKERVSFYHTYGYQKDNKWVVPTQGQSL